jgi:hypothetical protein
MEDWESMPGTVRNNPDKRRAYQRYRAWDNALEIREARYNWYQKNKPRILEKARRLREIKKSLPGTFTKKEWVEMQEYFNGRCVYPECSHRIDEWNPLCADHIQPIHLQDGSLNPQCSNAAFNRQPLCKKHNSMKGNGNAIDYRPPGHPFVLPPKRMSRLVRLLHSTVLHWYSRIVNFYASR